MVGIVDEYVEKQVLLGQSLSLVIFLAHIAERRQCRLEGGKQGEAIKASNIYDLLFFCHAYGSLQSFWLRPPAAKKIRSKTLDMLDKLPESTQTAIQCINMTCSINPSKRLRLGCLNCNRRYGRRAGTTSFAVPGLQLTTQFSCTKLMIFYLIDNLRPTMLRHLFFFLFVSSQCKILYEGL